MSELFGDPRERTAKEDHLEPPGGAPPGPKTADDRSRMTHPMPENGERVF
ncbi:uncharacterized protein PITG_20858 [Phytophthora infestans T30-4]|uniref:Uncharacterized protein n=1 Tax=Phytophthora infestans (strain T30-4) TaxID=403677 RepID=D0P332_PHYIT|nr:uncharacterized protein PITG_20858 [Phytophthora infestans T30-4]EEY58804.1 hypothetical protein PITG_20858 [Phytophthora infestans T30-4]|eukprot:XP_002895295.1 hypothetical protein PITG_20858 [Phytophthora infestans T30-4]